ncbi:MAG: class E sortase [Rubrobacteraceae bacterium]|jgi:sortase A|nr:class E sortase [Rubrobacter sp.]
MAAILSLVMVFAGVGLLGYSMLGAGDAVAGMVRATIGGAEAPQTTDMKLTVPEMSRVENAPVYTAAASDTAALDQGAVHVEDTGFPWDAEANVYIAGHRLGYPGTGSFLQFRDLNKLENGDEMIIEDANGTTYTYTVFEKMTVAPDAYHVTAPVPGKNIISLQTCTLPDYSERLIVQGELTSIT